AVTLLLTRPNASYQGKYYQFDDVTIEPRPPKMPAIWVSGGSRVPAPTEHDAPVTFLRVMGTHRSYEHLQECYMVGSIDRINMRIDDLRKAGLQYLVLGPVTDD